MKSRILCALLGVVLFASCGEFNKVLKSKDPEVKYEYAKKYFDEKKYSRAFVLLEELQSHYMLSSREQEILFLLAQSYFYNKDYQISTQYYTRYYNKFPKGEYVELARFNAPYGLYLDSPDARLDQSGTLKAIQGFQEFMEYFPKSEKIAEARQCMFDMQEKLAYKELMSATLYYNLGLYSGNNYESCVVTSREALKSYPYSAYAEEFQFLIVKSRYELALHSIESKKPVRYRDVVDEHFNYKNMYPDGKFLKDSEKFYRQALKVVGKELDDATIKVVEEEKKGEVPEVKED